MAPPATELALRHTHSHALVHTLARSGLWLLMCAPALSTFADAVQV